MAKDPAFLFYSGDFLIGTAFMTDEQVGKYTRLLCLQHQHGPLSRQKVLAAVHTWDEEVMAKFEHHDGVYFNARLEQEREKRQRFTDSRRNNLAGKPHKGRHKAHHKGAHMGRHMENENENRIVNKDNKKQRFGSDDLVLLTPKELAKLHARFGQKTADQLIETLNNGIGSKGYKYKSHYHTILNWARRDGITKPREEVQAEENARKLAEWEQQGGTPQAAAKNQQDLAQLTKGIG